MNKLIRIGGARVESIHGVGKTVRGREFEVKDQEQYERMLVQEQRFLTPEKFDEQYTFDANTQEIHSKMLHESAELLGVNPHTGKPADENAPQEAPKPKPVRIGRAVKSKTEEEE